MKYSFAILFALVVNFATAPAFAEKKSKSDPDHVYLDKSNFNKLVGEKDRLIIVEVTASWCGWCHKLNDEVFSEIRKTQKDTAIYYIDFDKQSKEWIAEKHITISLPGVTLIKNGKVLARLEGYINWERFQEWMRDGQNGIGNYADDETEDTKVIAFEKN